MDNIVCDPTLIMDNTACDQTQTMEADTHEPTLAMDHIAGDLTVKTNGISHDPTPIMDDIACDQTPIMDDIASDPTPIMDDIASDPTPIMDDIASDPTPIMDDIASDSTQIMNDIDCDSTPTMQDIACDSTPIMNNIASDSTPIMDDIDRHSTPTMHDIARDSTPIMGDIDHDSTQTMHDIACDSTPIMNNTDRDSTPIMDDTDRHSTPIMHDIASDSTLTMHDIACNPSLSLREKLNACISKKKHQGVKPTAHILNQCAPWCFFVVAGGVAFWGVAEALPVLYGHWDGVLLVNQLFGVLVFLELAINWICIRYVDSSYVPAIHGIKPPELLENENTKNIKLKKGQKLYKMFVATSLPDAHGNVERSAVPYWSWVACVVCKRLRPPRCHHCVLCNRCVLKRDHHCFFAQACIGVNNLRHFVVFLFWAFVGCLWSWLNMLPYFLIELLPNMSYLDVLTPYSFVRCLLGYQEFLICFLTFLGWMLTMFLVFTGIHFSDTVVLLLKGATSFEQDNNIILTDSRSKRERLHSVFGHYWLLNFLFPCHMVFQPLENAVQWPDTTL